MEEVTIRIDHGERVIQGDMLDVSPRGFRLRYHGKPLDVGSEVEISYRWGQVKARIVWLHVAGGWCELGFLIQEEKESLQAKKRRPTSIAKMPV